MNTFWEYFFELPAIFVMIWISILLLGIFFVLWELANRKMKIDKGGVTFDRLRTKEPFWLRWLKYRRDDKKHKTSVEEMANRDIK